MYIHIYIYMHVYFFSTAIKYQACSAGGELKILQGNFTFLLSNINLVITNYTNKIHSTFLLSCITCIITSILGIRINNKGSYLSAIIHGRSR